MRVLYFHQHFSTPAGSTGTRSYEMAQELLRAGHQVTMVCGSYALGKTGIEEGDSGSIRRGSVDGIDIVQIHLPYSNHDSFLKRSLVFLRFSLSCIGIAFRSDYDLLFATSTPLTAGIPGIAMRIFRPSKPFVFEVRDLWPELPRAMGVITNPVVLGAMGLLEKASYHAASVCIGLSPGIVDGIKKAAPADKLVEMIPNGCDLQFFADAKAMNWDAPTGLPEGFVAVFTGAHGIANGLFALLDAAKILKERGRQDINIVLVGDGRVKVDLQERAKRESLSSVRFLKPIPKPLIRHLLSEADVGLMVLQDVPAFYYGTSPNKFFDYIAAELPVINNYPGWLADMIEETGCGLVVPPDDPSALATALETFADNPDRIAKAKAAGLELASTRFDRSDQARRFVSLLEDAADPVANEQ